MCCWASTSGQSGRQACPTIIHASLTEQIDALPDTLAICLNFATAMFTTSAIFFYDAQK